MIWGQGDFWIDRNGVNLLSGVECHHYPHCHHWECGEPCDPSNPPLLRDSFILDFLVTIPAARASFDRLLPLMLPAEQTRLNRIALMASNGLIVDPVTEADRLQHRLNAAPVQRGGGFFSIWVNGT